MGTVLGQHANVYASVIVGMGYPADDAILDELEETALTPTALAERTGYERSYVHKRLTHLRDLGEVDRISRGLYQKSDTK